MNLYAGAAKTHTLDGRQNSDFSSDQDQFNEGFDSAVKTQRNLSTAAIVGISIGAIVFVCGLIAFVVFLWKASNRKKRAETYAKVQSDAHFAGHGSHNVNTAVPYAEIGYGNVPQVVQGYRRSEEHQGPYETANYGGGEVRPNQYELQGISRPVELPR